MASLMNIALNASGLLSKYLNQIFVLSREIKKNGMIVTPANYDDLGILLWIVIMIGFIFPIITIWMFNPDPNDKSVELASSDQKEKTDEK